MGGLFGGKLKKWGKEKIDDVGDWVEEKLDDVGDSLDVIVDVVTGSDDIIKDITTKDYKQIVDSLFKTANTLTYKDGPLSYSQEDFDFMMSYNNGKPSAEILYNFATVNGVKISNERKSEYIGLINEGIEGYQITGKEGRGEYWDNVMKPFVWASDKVEDLFGAGANDEAQDAFHKDIEEQFKPYQAAFDAGKITKEEYEAKRSELAQLSIDTDKEFTKQDNTIVGKKVNKVALTAFGVPFVGGLVDNLGKDKDKDKDDDVFSEGDADYDDADPFAEHDYTTGPAYRGEDDDGNIVWADDVGQAYEPDSEGWIPNSSYEKPSDWGDKTQEERVKYLNETTGAIPGITDKDGNTTYFDPNKVDWTYDDAGNLNSQNVIDQVTDNTGENNIDFEDAGGDIDPAGEPNSEEPTRNSTKKEDDMPNNSNNSIGSAALDYLKGLGGDAFKMANIVNLAAGTLGVYNAFMSKKDIDANLLDTDASYFDLPGVDTSGGFLDPETVDTKIDIGRLDTDADYLNPELLGVDADGNLVDDISLDRINKDTADYLNAVELGGADSDVKGISPQARFLNAASLGGTDVDFKGISPQARFLNAASLGGTDVSIDNIKTVNDDGTSTINIDRLTKPGAADAIKKINTVTTDEDGNEINYLDIDRIAAPTAENAISRVGEFGEGEDDYTDAEQIGSDYDPSIDNIERGDIQGLSKRKALNLGQLRAGINERSDKTLRSILRAKGGRNLSTDEIGAIISGQNQARGQLVQYERDDYNIGREEEKFKSQQDFERQQGNQRADIAETGFETDVAKANLSARQEANRLALDVDKTNADIDNSGAELELRRQIANQGASATEAGMKLDVDKTNLNVDITETELEQRRQIANQGASTSEAGLRLDADKANADIDISEAGLNQDRARTNLQALQESNRLKANVAQSNVDTEISEAGLNLDRAKTNLQALQDSNRLKADVAKTNVSTNLSNEEINTRRAIANQNAAITANQLEAGVDRTNADIALAEVDANLRRDISDQNASIDSNRLAAGVARDNLNADITETELELRKDQGNQSAATASNNLAAGVATTNANISAEEARNRFDADKFNAQSQTDADKTNAYKDTKATEAILQGLPAMAGAIASNNIASDKNDRENRLFDFQMGQMEAGETANNAISSFQESANALNAAFTTSQEGYSTEGVSSDGGGDTIYPEEDTNNKRARADGGDPSNNAPIAEVPQVGGRDKTYGETRDTKGGISVDGGKSVGGTSSNDALTVVEGVTPTTGRERTYQEEDRVSSSTPVAEVPQVGGRKKTYEGIEPVADVKPVVDVVSTRRERKETFVEPIIDVKSTNVGREKTYGGGLSTVSRSIGLANVSKSVPAVGDVEEEEEVVAAPVVSGGRTRTNTASTTRGTKGGLSIVSSASKRTPSTGGRKKNNIRQRA